MDCEPLSLAYLRNMPTNLIIRSPTGSLFFTGKTRRRHLDTSLLKSSTSKSSSKACCFLELTGSYAHASWIFLSWTASLRAVAVVRCASPKILQICSRKVVASPSSGMSTALAEARARGAARFTGSGSADARALRLSATRLGILRYDDVGIFALSRREADVRSRCRYKAVFVYVRARGLIDRDHGQQLADKSPRVRAYCVIGHQSSRKSLCSLSASTTTTSNVSHSGIAARRHGMARRRERVVDRGRSAVHNCCFQGSGHHSARLHRWYGPAAGLVSAFADHSALQQLERLP